jgi:TolB-like protein
MDSIVVLPLKDLMVDPLQVNVTEELTNWLISFLAKICSLREVSTRRVMIGP